MRLVRKLNFFFLILLFHLLILIFLVLRYSAMTDTEHKQDVLKLLNSLVNILTIIKHFQIKIKEWLVSKNLNSPSEEQVLSIVRENYDLTLKVIDNLDSYERYNEQKHSAFFNTIVTEVIGDLRMKNCHKFLIDFVNNA